MVESYTLRQGKNDDFKGLFSLVRKHTRKQLVINFLLPFEHEDKEALTGTYTHYEFLKKWKLLEEKEKKRLTNADLIYFKEFAPDLAEYYETNFIDEINASPEIKKMEDSYGKATISLCCLNIIGEDTTNNEILLKESQTKMYEKLEKICNDAFISCKELLIDIKTNNLNVINKELETIDENSKEIPFTVTDYKHTPLLKFLS
ncbi:MAG: hypothetical protein KAS11_00315 [Candidatus Aenigmarchaeota archaeon]|nr:hypothetical protein [Candidatus Aenigmarchaeota archaeon]